MENRNYQILGTLATGGTAVLYKAIQTSLDREVVIKKLHSHLVSDPNFRRRFELEAKAAASLDHENIVRIIDTGAAGDNFYIVMEYINGMTLRDILDARGPLDEELTLLIAREICLGLDHAHQRGIVHRDIKPANIMVTFEGQVKITDFGLAKLTQSHLQQTVADTLLGTPLYMSPEQAIGEAVDGRSDLFSLGTICYELLTGKQPFIGETYAAVIQRIIKGSVRPPSKLNPSVTQRSESAVMKALSREPGRRFRTALEMARAIESALGQDAVLRSRERLCSLVAGDRVRSAAAGTGGPSRRRGRKILPWAAAALIAAAGGWYLHGNPQKIDALKTGIKAMRTSQPASPEDNPILSAQAFPQGVQIIALPVDAASGPASSGMEAARPVPGGGEGLRPDTAAGPVPGTGSAEDSAGVQGPGEAEPPKARAREQAEETTDNAGAEAGPDTAGAADVLPEMPASREEPRGDDKAGGGAAAVEKPQQQAAAGFIEIVVEPEADILVDGSYRTTGNRYGPVEIAAGVHSIACRQKDFREYREEIRITRGELSRRRIRLEQVTGSIVFDTDPGIRVFVDGKFLGITPLSSPASFTAGKHLVDLKKAGFRDWSNEVFIPADETLRLRVALTAM